MKRLIAAVSFAVLASPVLAAEAPFEQTQFDRGLPTLEQNASAGASSKATGVWAEDYNFIAPAQ
jgi:opacity protein-like surface antigen